MAQRNQQIYNEYAARIPSSEEKLRCHMLMSLITADSLEPSMMDILGSVSGSVLNDRSSQAPSSRMSGSIITESIESE
jgi:hypothetical protein